MKQCETHGLEHCEVCQPVVKGIRPSLPDPGECERDDTYDPVPYETNTGRAWKDLYVEEGAAAKLITKEVENGKEK